MMLRAILALTVIVDAVALGSHVAKKKSRLSQIRSSSNNNNIQRLQENSLRALELPIKKNWTQPHLKLYALNDRPIDIVYCWAGEDAAQRAKEGDIMNGGKINNLEGLSFTEMRLSVHSLQLNVPWFNKAYFLVDGTADGPAPLPAWVSNDPRIEMVDRCSLFPRKKDCPTKNSHACQSVAHLIPGLQEHFVYMEDDIFILNPVTPADFFAADGRPLMTAHVEPSDLKWIYDTNRHKTHDGPDKPPDDLPTRIQQFSHMPMPLTLSFCNALEKEYTDWFAFVRSHTTPFECCDASVYAYGLAEDFTRIWPAMLFLWGAGVAPEGDYEATCWCQESVNEVSACVMRRINLAGTVSWGPQPGLNSLNVNSCTKAAQWQAASGRIAKHLDRISESLQDHSGPLVPIAMFARLQERIPTAALVVIYIADLVLILGAGFVMFSRWRSADDMPAGFLGLTTFPQFAVLMLYIFFSVLHMFLQRHAGSTGYSVISATVLVYTGKLTVAFIMFLCRADVHEGFSALLAPGCTRFGKLPAFMLPMIPGGLLAGYDALSFVSLGDLDPATYQIMVHMRIIFVCFLWQLMFQRKLSGTQWFAILLFTTAGIQKGIDVVQVPDVRLYRGIQTVALQTLMSAFANVSSEVLLKEMPMPADLVNTCMYMWGFIWLIVAMLCHQGYGAIYSELLSPDAWARLQADSYMVGSILSLIGFGITTAYLLKLLSNIVKELSGGCVIVITCVVQMVTSTMGILGCIMAILGIGVYGSDPLREKVKEAATPRYMSPRGVLLQSPRVEHGPGADFQIIDEPPDFPDVGADRAARVDP